jgi:hypothetical protein
MTLMPMVGFLVMEVLLNMEHPAVVVLAGDGAEEVEGIAVWLVGAGQVRL